MKNLDSHKTTLQRLTILVVIVATIKFLFEGGSITLFGHADAMTYGMFLGPILGAHGYAHAPTKITGKVDSPDETK